MADGSMTETPVSDKRLESAMYFMCHTAKTFAKSIGTALAVIVALLQVTAAHADAATSADPYQETDRIFQEFVLDAHIPGLAYGVVINGRLVHVGTFGIQDVESKRPVTADTLFRIASMTKAFTALTVLKLRDDGSLRLDAPAEDYVPELRGWKYPTDDSPKIRVHDLLNHVAGFVTDDPWGDRQTPLAEEAFTRLLRDGVPFTRVPQTNYEYSNLGYALLGRIVTNVSGHPYADTISSTLLRPLGMQSSGFVADAAPRERRALGYRWEDDAWRLEPTLGPGAFGAMGGIQTSVNDYAKWVSFLLAAWPARNGPESGPVKRSTVRELAQGSNFPRLRTRFGHTGAASCQQAANYAMGMNAAMDCELGLTLSHGGGYPGYGSHVLLLPERGVAIFALANRTYAAPSPPVWDSAIALLRAGKLSDTRPVQTSQDLIRAYEAAGIIYTTGSIEPAREQLAMNFLLDRTADSWAHELSTLKSRVGECDASAPMTASGALTGDFIWRCAHGRVKGNLELAPTRPTGIQQLKLEAMDP
jgi:serine-type D-Ala-D-Ala carboxypeptidase/endopeptidase